MWQRASGTWVVEITDFETHEKIWTGSLQSAVPAAREHAIRLVCLRGANAQRNFPNGQPLLTPVDPRVATARKMWEDKEARERLKAEQASEAYMVKLHHQYQEHVE